MVFGVINIEHASNLLDLRGWPYEEILLHALAKIKGEGLSRYKVRHGSCKLLNVLGLAVNLFGFGLGVCEGEE